MTELLGELLDWAQLVRWDDRAKLLLYWKGGHGIHAATLQGREVAYWNIGDFAAEHADREDVEASMQERIDRQDYADYC